MRTSCPSARPWRRAHGGPDINALPVEGLLQVVERHRVEVAAEQGAELEADEGLARALAVEDHVRDKARPRRGRRGACRGRSGRSGPRRSPARGGCPGGSGAAPGCR